MIEGLELMSFMDDQEVFVEIQKRLNNEEQAALSSRTFKEMIGKQLSNDFLTTLVMHFLNVKKAQGFDSTKLATELLEKCPSYYTINHHNLYKAEILLERAGGIESKATQINMINEATSLLFDNLQLVELERIIPLLMPLEQYSLALQLCIQVAEDQEQRENEGSAQVINFKNNCYQFILHMLEEIFNTIMNKKGKNVGILAPTLFLHLFEHYPTEKLTELVDQLIKESFAKSKDEMLHLTMFRWMTSHQMYESLLNITSPYLDAFIKSNFGDSVLRPSEFLYKYMLAKKSTFSSSPDFIHNGKIRTKYYTRRKYYYSRRQDSIS